MDVCTHIDALMFYFLILIYPYSTIMDCFRMGSQAQPNSHEFNFFQHRDFSRCVYIRYMWYTYTFYFFISENGYFCAIAVFGKVVSFFFGHEIAFNLKIQLLIEKECPLSPMLCHPALSIEKVSNPLCDILNQKYAHNIVKY